MVFFQDEVFVLTEDVTRVLTSGKAVTEVFVLSKGAAGVLISVEAVTVALILSKGVTRVFISVRAVSVVLILSKVFSKVGTEPLVIIEGGIDTQRPEVLEVCDVSKASLHPQYRQGFVCADVSKAVQHLQQCQGLRGQCGHRQDCPEGRSHHQDHRLVIVIVLGFSVPAIQARLCVL